MERNRASMLGKRRREALTYRSHVAERPLSRVRHSVRVDGVAVALRNILKGKILHGGWICGNLSILRQKHVSKAVAVMGGPLLRAVGEDHGSAADSEAGGQE
jgi:hypothetical protein